VRAAGAPTHPRQRPRGGGAGRERAAALAPRARWPLDRSRVPTQQTPRRPLDTFRPLRRPVGAGCRRAVQCSACTAGPPGGRDKVVCVAACGHVEAESCVGWGGTELKFCRLIMERLAYRSL